MILTEDEANLLGRQFTAMHREMLIYVTDKCNMHCSVCYMDSGPEKHAFIKKSYIRKLFKYIDASWFIEIIGGEPTLNMPAVEYIVKLSKRKNVKTRLATNGKLLLNDKMLKKVLDLKIDVLSLGYNEYHSLKVDEAQRIVDIFSDKSVFTRLTFNSFETTDLSNLDTKNCFIIKDTLMQDGRGSFKDDFQQFTHCACQGLALFPDGSLRSGCVHGPAACYFGNIKDLKDFSVIKSYLSRYPKFRWAKNLKGPYACVKNSLLDKRFDDPNFVLNI